MVYEKDISFLLNYSNAISQQIINYDFESKKEMILFSDSNYHFYCAKLKMLNIPKESILVKAAEKLYLRGKIEVAEEVIFNFWYSLENAMEKNRMVN